MNNILKNIQFYKHLKYLVYIFEQIISFEEFILLWNILMQLFCESNKITVVGLCVIQSKSDCRGGGL